LGLLLGTTLAMRGFWAAFEPRESGRPQEVWLLFIGMGIGLLAKGPIAVVLSGLPIGLWMLLTGNIKTSWQRLPWVKGSLLTLAIAAPWYVMAEIRTPGFWEYFFIGEHWNRFTVTGWAGDKYGTAHATQRGAIWLFALAAVMPWTALLPMLWLGRKAAPALQSPGPSGYSRDFTFYLLAFSVAPCLFFTMSGNILWTYVLPALPAIALLAARWLSTDARTRWVNGVVGTGVLAMACLVAAFFGREQLNDSWKSAKTVVLAYQAKGAGQPLLFMGDLPYSASYYAQGKVKALPGYVELAARLVSGPVFVALNPDQVKALPPELAARLRLEATSGAYQLYSSAAK
jgi:4-amino-4-deoxy-L-arabinose transferase-like glycosyltransferase